MNDSFQLVDVSSLAAYTATTLVVPADKITLVNRSGVAVDVSFDGTNKVGELTASGLEVAQEYDITHRLTNLGTYPRATEIWLKRQTGTGGGPLYVAVYSERI